MKPLFLLLLLLTMCAKPQPPIRECPCTHTDPKKRLYNQVLTELIEQHFYSSYLPDSANEQIRQAIQLQFPQGSDFKLGTEEFKRYETVRKELEAVQQNRLFGDSARLKTIYLDTASRMDFAYAIKSFTKAKLDLEDTDNLKSIAAQFGTVLNPERTDSLTQLQQRISASDFQLCTAKIAQLPTQNKLTQPNQIGVIRFSEIVFNANKTKALLSYAWTCEGNCGFAEVLLIEKTNGNWHIKQAEELWTS